ncbi:GTPase Era [Plebeiibacterium sediminum]|uniref:GTPase Era n=1 Tax=Plebeiibacterium sediminum TaxID=2992112 RepID=A0AAE3SFR3_9BACT|nr:GTPase Era [Plebeiobacterium sediminum]MCW3787367.1 GTPase Era [Plebeiobacterium sediminum]
MKHKSGFVNIVGNPNVGKSTLTNKLVGEKLSIITSKAQTTRHRILGIVNEEDYQIVFSDTPGVLKPNYKLQESMLRFSKTALQDADIIIYMTDVVEKIDKNSDFLNSVKKTMSPVILVINKIDESNPEQLDDLVSIWKEELPNAEIFPMSALHGFNTDNLLKRIKELLPEGEPYYDKEALTDKPTRFFVSEIIREKILLYYQKEIPYSVEVEIEEFKEAEDQVNIRAIIHVARESQKGIIIGHKGSALKKTGTEARKDMEKFLDKKVFLQLYVKVNKDWRDKDKTLRNFGYDQK